MVKRSRSHLMLRVICCRFKDTFLYTCRPSGNEGCHAVASTTRSYRRIMGSRAQLAPTEEVCLNLGKHRFQVMGSRAQLAPTEEATIASKAVTPIANREHSSLLQKSTEELWDREHSSLLQKSYGIASTARSYNV